MDLKNYLPYFYLDSIEVVNIQEAISKENDIVKADIEDFKNQFFVSTCTWSIKHWEEYVGLISNPSLDLEVRRKAVIAKLSSQGTCTREMLISICENFTGYDVDIIDNLDDYSITIRINANGAMKNLSKLEETIEEIKPAYINFNFAIVTQREALFQTKFETYNVDYCLCGTFNCGIEPDVVTEGIAYTDNVNIGTFDTNLFQEYAISGTVNAGGEKI